MRRLVFLLPAVPLLAAALSGCGASGGCADYIGLPTPQDRYDIGRLVVVATVAPTDRTIESGAVYAVHRARIESVVKGPAVGAAIDVIAPTSCFVTGRRAEYDEGADPLNGVTRAVLYLNDMTEDGAYSLVAPGAVDRLPEGSPLPFSTATPSPTPTP